MTVEQNMSHLEMKEGWSIRLLISVCGVAPPVNCPFVITV